MQVQITSMPVLAEMQTNRNRSVEEASHASAVLLVFLRHFGCTFCREALQDLAAKKPAYEKEGVQLIFVHMSDSETADAYFNQYQIDTPEYISDPDCLFYARFGLGKGKFSQLFGLQVMIRGFESGVLKGNGIGPFIGDGFQMPGVFLVQNGVIREQFIHKLASDRPDYDYLVSCCTIN